MEANGDYLWIRTRDGSPTLWNNKLAESFRSRKGAYTESLHAFVLPAIRTLPPKDSLFQEPLIAGEFGLGPGTNWLLLTSLLKVFGYPLAEYVAIESDPTVFAMGLKKWDENFSNFQKFLVENFPERAADVEKLELGDLPLPRIFSSLAEMLSAQELHSNIHIWMHDPFGIEANPDGYRAEIFQQCAPLWHKSMHGFSYATNRSFKLALESISGIQVRSEPTGHPGLKRERLEWSWE